MAKDRTELETEKLTLEIEQLRRSRGWEEFFNKLFIPLLTAIVSVGGFWVGISHFNRQEKSEHEKEADNRAAEVEKINREYEARERTLHFQVSKESARPFWDRQVAIYMEAADTAATVATSDDTEALRKAEAQFWILYYGRLAAVEDVGLNPKKPGEQKTPIERAMVEFAHCLNGKTKRDRAELKELALKLSRAVRDAIRPAFSLQSGVAKQPERGTGSQIPPA